MDRKDHLCCASAAYHKAEKQRVQLLCCATVTILQSKRLEKYTDTELGDGKKTIFAVGKPQYHEAEGWKM